MAVGDTCASFAGTLVAVTLLALFLWPVVFALVWRPLRLQYAHRVLVEDRRRVMLDAGLEFDERTLPNMYKDPPCDIAWRLHLPGGCPIDES